MPPTRVAKTTTTTRGKVEGQVTVVTNTTSSNAPRHERVQQSHLLRHLHMQEYVWCVTVVLNCSRRLAITTTSQTFNIGACFVTILGRNLVILIQIVMQRVK